MANEPPLFILGPTASGKHKVAIKIAETLNTEIISIDSMKVYREMDIGTAKPSESELNKIHHHLINIADPSETYNVGRFVKDAGNAEKAVVAKGKLPLFAGGTALYYKALVYGLFEGVGRDDAIRDRLLEEAEGRGEYLHDKLANVDKASADKIHPNDLKRIVRALEVYEMTGKPISSMQTHFAKPSKKGVFVCITCDRAFLRQRISDRTREMFKQGFVDEVERLLKRENGWGKEARSSVGYKDVCDYLAGKRGLDETIQEVITKTAVFAKRQMTWFRGLKELHFIEFTQEDTSETIAKKILTYYNSQK